MADDLYFDDWGVGSDLAAGSSLPSVGWLGMDPATLAALIQGGSSVLGKAMSPSANMPRSEASASVYSPFDSSGWSVATGGNGTASASGGASPWLLAGVGVVIVVVVIAAMKAKK